MLPESIELQVVTPEKHVLSENVQSIEMTAKDVYLGVLPGHAPLITLLGVGTWTYHKGGETRYLSVMNGYAEVLPDRVIVLAEISEKAEEIDVARSKAAHDRAQAEMAQHGIAAEEYEREKLALERALIRMQAAGQTGAAGGGAH